MFDNLLCTQVGNLTVVTLLLDGKDNFEDMVCAYFNEGESIFQATKAGGEVRSQIDHF